MLSDLTLNMKLMGLHMAHHLYPTVSILFTPIYRRGEQVGCTSSGEEKQNKLHTPPATATFHLRFPSAQTSSCTVPLVITAGSFLAGFVCFCI